MVLYLRRWLGMVESGVGGVVLIAVNIVVILFVIVGIENGDGEGV